MVIRLNNILSLDDTFVPGSPQTPAHDPLRPGPGTGLGPQCGVTDGAWVRDGSLILHQDPRYQTSSSFI